MLFSGLISIFKPKQNADEKLLDSETANAPKSVSDVPLLEGGSGQVDTHLIRTIPADVARVQTRGSGAGGASLIAPIKF
jgi:hypothetical protein